MKRKIGLLGKLDEEIAIAAHRVALSQDFRRAVQAQAYAAQDRALRSGLRIAARYVGRTTKKAATSVGWIVRTGVNFWNIPVIGATGTHTSAHFRKLKI